MPGIMATHATNGMLCCGVGVCIIDIASKPLALTDKEEK